MKLITYIRDSLLLCCVIAAWQLNERMYGELEGLNKEETDERYGTQQFHEWHRSYHIPPPTGESLEMCDERAVAYFGQCNDSTKKTHFHYFVCSWPDEIKRRPEWSWTYALHYADTPDYECNYEYCRYCPKDECVTGAIFNYTSHLMFQFHYNLTEALLFVSHFMGDVHQPLHEGYIGDLGGNKVKLNWYNQETNLHRVWDDKIIESALKKYYNSSLSVMISSLQNKLEYGWPNDVPSWESCPRHQTVCPNRYASESVDLACKYAYQDATAGTTLGDYYFLSRLYIVEKRIAQGGICLAATLNRIFSSKAELAAA